MAADTSFDIFSLGAERPEPPVRSEGRERARQPVRSGEAPVEVGHTPSHLPDPSLLGLR